VAFCLQIVCKFEIGSILEGGIKKQIFEIIHHKMMVKKKEVGLFYRINLFATN